MAIRAASYLKRNRFGIYYFRRVVPSSLQSHFAFRQIARSTGTARLCEARGLALRFAVSVDLLFERVRAMKQKPMPNELEAELIVRLEFNEDGALKSVETDAKPEEAEAATRLVPELINAARGVGKKIEVLSRN